MPSAIEWTDETWNPITGCTKVSPGCDHCYMYALYPRLKAMGVEGYLTAPNDVRLLPNRLTTPLRWKKPRLVFVNSMSDIFHPRVPFEFVEKMFFVMSKAASERGHIFQVLTKRPGRAAHWWRDHYDRFPDGWPPGVWLGTSVETQKYAPRLTVLARVPAPVRFVSAEPLLGPIDLTPWLTDGTLHWIIVGGESGPGARPMKTDWVRSIRDQATRNNTPLFLKQLGGIRNKRGGTDATVDGRTWHEMPIRRAIPH